MKSGCRLILIGLLLASSHTAGAEPWLAVHTGDRCVACHVSPTGGGKRTTFGAIFAQTALSARVPETIWDGTITDRFSLGADARVNAASTVIPGEDDRFAFEMEEALIYAEFKLIQDRMILYLDSRVAPGGVTNREAYALFWFANQFYVRAGRMFLPYGWRLEDDTAFIRQVPGINYNTPDDGVEIGLERQNVSINFAVTNGTAGGGENDVGKQYSLLASYIRRKWRAGFSFNFNDVENAERQMQNVFFGLRTWKINWLFEADYIKDEGFPTGTRKQLLGLGEANFMPVQGHNIKFTYEYFDPDKDVDEDDRSRASIVYEYFPIQFTQVTVGARINDGIPQNNLQNTEEYFVQLHAYF